MNPKRVIAVLFALVFLTSFSQVVYADEMVQETLTWLFYDLPELIKDEDPEGIVVFKVFLWAIIFGVVYYALTKFFHGTNRVPAVVALAFSIIATVFIPNEFIGFITAEFFIVALVAIVTAPLLILLHVVNVLTARRSFGRVVGLAIVLALGIWAYNYSTGFFDEFGEGEPSEFGIPPGKVISWAAFGILAFMAINLLISMSAIGKHEEPTPTAHAPPPTPKGPPPGHGGGGPPG